MADNALTPGLQLPLAIELQPITALPPDFETLRAEAAAEGFDNIETLWSQWQDGSIRFIRPGERLVAAYVAGERAGIGGITEDFVDRTWLRMRRFYVRPTYRRAGIAAAITRNILDEALPLGRPICVHAGSPRAALFWEAMGFVPVDRENTTHILPEAGR